MTTHDRDKVIAAAKECYHPYSEWNIDIERFYTIAFEAGRQADKLDAERYRWLREQNATLDDKTFYVGIDDREAPE